MADNEDLSDLLIGPSKVEHPIIENQFASSITKSTPDREPQTSLERSLWEAVKNLDDTHPYLDVAVVAPSLSLIKINAAPPSDEASFHRWDADGMADKAMMKLEAISFREELMHGERQRFGLARNCHLLIQEQIRALFEFLAGEKETGRAAQRIESIQRNLEKIYEEQHPLVEAIDKYLIVSVLSEQTDGNDLNQYLSETAELYIGSYEDADLDDLVKILQYELERIKKDVYLEETPADPEVFKMLQEIEQTYDRGVAEAVADVTLDIPYLISPVDSFGYDGRTLTPDELNLQDRLAATREGIEQIDTPTDYNRDELREMLETGLGETADKDDLRVAQSAHLPLLDVPREATDESESQEGYQAMQEAPSELGRLITGSFRFIGNFGGAIYHHDKITKNWLINPWIETEPVETSFEATEYGELWQQFYLGHQFIRDLFLDVRRFEKSEVDCHEVVDLFTNDIFEEDIECPFCDISRAGKCGTDGCACMSYLDAINGRRAEFLRAHFKIRHSDS